MSERKKTTNRLINEKSPYLQQHAYNPVDWYPWGEEAFEMARHSDKPIFLSIGYATCHWCHVMEKESFENPEVAKLMNDAFINIKVDREELPEVDNLYMDFAQSMISGAAGWPLNVLLTPDLEPFFAATYLPSETRKGMMGMKELIERIKHVWNSDERERIEAQANKIVEIFNEAVHVSGSSIPEKSTIEVAMDLLYKMADPIYGGLKGAPKFPIGYQINLFLQYSAVNKDSRALFLAERTLVMMHKGGIYDHLGGGFSRYSVDERWQVPHFEKMLYDNALLIDAYVKMWQATQKSFYKTVCEEIIDYVQRTMTDPNGGFFSAEDADSEGKEGTFYTWTMKEIREILPGYNGELFCEYYQVTPEGNFEGKNILHIQGSIEEFAQSKGLDPIETEEIISKQKKILWEAREKRPHPFKDDKVITSWNGLMIYSLANAGAAFNSPIYSKLATDSARFIKNNLWKNDRLLRRWREGSANFKGNLDDYVFLIRGLIALFETNQGTEWLEWALKLTSILEEQFKAVGGAFYQTDGTDKHLILRKCHFSDGAEPSGNALHCENLMKLYQITGNHQYLVQAEDIFKAVKKYFENYPPGYCYHLMNLCRYYDKHAPTIIVSLNEKREHQEEIKHLLFNRFIACKSIIWNHVSDSMLHYLLPETEQQKPIHGDTTLYICFEGVCKKPLTELSEMIEEVNNLG